ncbi:hypothetical protein OIO90_003879 [Microbotryomycetes sp. JL221]|nr:hypothetical protein OIO90_003879 [Microbotryomycetes sp. JL221]
MSPLPFASSSALVSFDSIDYNDLSPEREWVRLGKGSFGTVWRAEYLGLEVAVKEVMPSGEYNVDKYLERECRILADCRHPNIVQLIGFALAPSPPSYSSPSESNRPRLLIVSEYLSRGNLRQYICDKSLPFPWRLRLSFAIDVARALAYLHSRKCMHRDLKGENLLVTENERIKVCDFGFARIAAQNEEEMKRITFAGTDGYMSPEILLGEKFGLPTDAKRPDMLQILKTLRTIEKQVHDADLKELSSEQESINSHSSSGGTTWNVGSVSFAGSTKRGRSRRPQAPRLPSFEGRVQVGSSATDATYASARMDISQAVAVDQIDSEEEDEVALLGLADVNTLDSRLEWHNPLSTFENLDSEGESRYSTALIGRNWKARLNIEDLASSLRGSHLTVKPSPQKSPLQTETDLPEGSYKSQAALPDDWNPSRVVHRDAVDHEVAIVADSIPETARVEPPSLHRFSLIKPTLQRLLSSFSPTSSSLNVSMVNPSTMDFDAAFKNKISDENVNPINKMSSLAGPNGMASLGN